MAEAFAKNLFGDRAQVRSAGLAPQSKSDALVAIECLRNDFGIDASSHVPRHITQGDVDMADVIVAMDKGIAGQLECYAGNNHTIYAV